MTVRVSVAKGVDLDYAWNSAAGRDQRGAGYYLSAAEAGEPPGIWRGTATRYLGLSAGEEIERADYDLLFGERKAPDGTKLGRAPGNGGAKAHETYLRLLATEPQADASRRRELRMRAQRETRQSPLYYDVTVSPGKSISVFHASLGENARRAMMRGDAKEAARWAARVEEMDAMIAAANDAALAYLQAEAGYARVGTHAGRVNGQPTGRYAEADLVVASWYQHTSRDGDPQLHVHNQVAHAARVRESGKWLAPDNRGYFEQARAAGALAAAHLEEALTRRFGLSWVERPDGQGNEIKGVSQAVMDAFSSRRRDIDRRMQEELIPEFEATWGHYPTQSQLASLRQEATLATRKHKPEGKIDWNATHAGWADKLARTAGVDLALVAREVTRNRARPRKLTDAEIERAASKALAKVAAEKSSWTRADLLAHVGRLLPRTGAGPQAATDLAQQVTDRAIAGEFGPVACLEAPEAVAMPADLIRLDGRSVYQRHGVTRYATRAQLSAEEQLADLSQRTGGARMDPQAAAELLGASVGELEEALAGRAHDATAILEASGLRLDQAAAAWRQLTSPQLVNVINAPPGAGKTTTAAAMAKIWPGQVVGVTPSQVSRNTLGKGVPEAYNFAQFLGDLPGEPGARGHVPVSKGALIIGDEASMFSTPVLLRITRIAAASGAKLILVGDTQQLAAVENGGGMQLVANINGYAQLAEPIRFRAAWERDASLRLRLGDASVLAEYADHGRIRAGELERVLDDAAGAYIARTLEGWDVLLSVRDNSTRRELSRRIRGELKHLGKVDSGRSVVIGEGQRASAGDLIVCVKNDNRQNAGGGETLANKHLLRVEQITSDGKLVLRRVLDADPETGQRQYCDQTFTYAKTGRFELGYAVTQHCAQSRTVYSGLEVITGSEDQQGTLVGATRGTDENLIYVATPSPRLADPKPAARPAPEIERARRLDSEHTGRTALQGDGRLSAGKADEQLQAGIAILADVLEREGAAVSAVEYRSDQLSNADHLGILHAIWEDQTWQAQAGRYKSMVAGELTDEYPADSPQARWLYRTLRSAELAGMDPAEVLRQAVAAGSLAGSRDLASVIDHRIRKQIGSPVPLPRVPWSERVPDVGPGRQQFVSDTAAAMDDRCERLGAHAADAQLPMAVAALGPVPEDPWQRREWEQRASAVYGYREIYGYDHPAEPIGPEPSAAESPDKRQAWYDALRALGSAPGAELRGKTDGSLWLMRDGYETETSWAPRYVAPVLGMVRQHATDASIAVVRGEAEAFRAEQQGDDATAQRHRARAAASASKGALYRQQESLLEKADQQRREWRDATEMQRRLAVAADTELRRRHPELDIEPLKSAEPETPTEAERDEALRGAAVPGWVERLVETSERFREQMDAQANVMVPDEDPDYQPLGEAFPAWREAQQDAILQPPKPQMPPSGAVLERQAEREAG